MRKSSKLPYREGDCFAVPLRNGGFGVGLAARLDGKGVVLGYFFGPKRNELPEPAGLAQLSADDALGVYLFGDLSLIKGQWPLIGHHPRWQRHLWPLPAFGRYIEIGERAFRIEYSEESLTMPVQETPISIAECGLLPTDGIYGSGAIERVLTHLLPN